MFQFHNITDYIHALTWFRAALSTKVKNSLQNAVQRKGSSEVTSIILSPADVSMILILKEITKMKLSLINYDTGFPVEVDLKSIQNFLSDIEEITKSLNQNR